MTELEPLDGRTQRRERSAQKLYDAADALLADRTYDELTVEDICARANVGRATFFRIYETKGGLLREFNRRLARDAAQRLADAGDLDVLSALDHIRETILDTWRRAGRGHVGMANEFIHTSPSGDPHAAHPELLALVVERVSMAVERGELPDTVPADIAASLALIHLTTPIAHAFAGRDVDTDGLTRVLLHQWYAGMVSEPTPARRNP